MLFIQTAMKYILTTIGIFLLLISYSYAAPAPRYIAVNDKLNLCGEYWPGDEFTQNEIPSDWRIVEKDNFYPEECESLEYSNFNNDCCELIGYKYVDDIYTNYNENNIPWMTIGVIIVSPIILLLLFRKIKILSKHSHNLQNND